VAGPARSSPPPRSGTPVVGLIISSGLITALTMLNYSASLVEQFTFVILLATTWPRMLFPT
jgi:hypothetical protein